MKEKKIKLTLAIAKTGRDSYSCTLSILIEKLPKTIKDAFTLVI